LMCNVCILFAINRKKAKQLRKAMVFEWVGW
jgi:hypothetical protein